MKNLIYISILILATAVSVCAQTASKDSLNDPDHYYYLANKEARQVARWILKDSIEPGNNFSTYRVLDSLTTTKSESRLFYLKAFLRIMEKSEGSLADSVGNIALRYTSKYTREFLQREPPLTPHQFQRISELVASAILAKSDSSEDAENDMDAYFKLLQLNCKSCNSSTSETLDYYLQLVYQTLMDSIKK
jgi:hypothetical protein